MTKTTYHRPHHAGGIARIMSGFGPQIMLAPETGAGAGAEAAEAAAQAAAEAAATAAATATAEREAAAAAEAEAEAVEAAKNLTDAEKASLLREVMDKKQKLKIEKDAREAVEAELRKFDGIDLEKVKTLLEAEQNRERTALEEKGEFERLKAMIAEERTAEKVAWQTERDALTSQITSLNGTVDNLTVGQNFASSTYISENLVLTPTKARQLYGSHFEMLDGKTVAYNKPAGQAGRTLLVGADAEPLAFDVAMKKIIDLDPEKDTLIKSKVVPGAHSKTQQIKASAPGNDEGLTGASRIAAALARRKK